MIFRRLFALLFAVAVTLAPLGMPAVAQTAMAAPAPSTTHHGDMAGQAHCDEQPPPDPQGKVADKNCCVAMCVAVVVPAGVAKLPHYHAARERPGSDLDRRGFLGEIATPPPKRA